ncbi:MAG: phosphate butyryltransferase [Tissierellaceae bacterium]|nr:phosphate butyryltransferase [Tissierellaceae bacterium]
MAKSFEDLLELARSRGPKKVSVAVAQDRDVLSAVMKATELGISEPILTGDRNAIEVLAKDIGFDLSNVEIIHEEDKVEACRTATSLVSSGKADVLMKGLIDTSIIMKQVLDKEIGLRAGKIISHVAIFDIATYHKVFMVTDAAMNIQPDLNQKKEILENAVALAKSLDIEMPKVAVLASKEKVSPKMEATVHAKELTDMYKKGEITGCIVDGPFALDNIVSKESARLKGVDSEVAGEADIILAPNIDAGNALYKALTFLGNAKSAGLILGTKAPIILTSRADNEEAKLNSIALGVLMASK